MSGATIVLVHGAGAGAWAWEPVTRELDDLGVAHREIDLPSCGLRAAADAGVAGDAAALRELLDTLAQPVVLVGNSYGGVVISAGAVGHPAVARLVYVAAFMPEAGVPIMNQLVATDEFMEALTVGEDGSGGLDPERAADLVFEQSEPEAAQQAIARLGPSRLSDIDIVLPSVAWETIPSTYVVCTEDRAIPPAYQRQCATERATSNIEVPFDHAPGRSHPRELAEIFADICAEVVAARIDHGTRSA